MVGFAMGLRLYLGWGFRWGYGGFRGALWWGLRWCQGWVMEGFVDSTMVSAKCQAFTYGVSKEHDVK